MLKINDMKKTFRFALTALLVGGLSLAVTSCKDDDNSENNGTEQQGGDSVEGTITLADDQLSSLIYQWCDVQSYDLSGSALRTKTYDVTEGVVMDESRPTVRSVEVGTIEGADAYAARALYALGIDNQSPAGFTFSDAEVGTVSYKHGGGSDANVLATVDVDVKQLPGLTRMQLVKQLPENAGGGEPYYKLGDVISYTRKNLVTKQKETNYAICVSKHTKNEKAVFITLNDQEMHSKGKFGWKGVGNDTVWSASMPNASDQSLYNWLKDIVFDETKLAAVRNYLRETADLSENQINMVVPATDAQRQRLLMGMNDTQTLIFSVNMTAKETQVANVKAGSLAATNFTLRYIDDNENNFVCAPHGYLLANYVRYNTYWDFSSWDQWVPYITVIENFEADGWAERLKKIAAFNTVSPSHFKWKRLGDFDLTVTLDQHKLLRDNFKKKINPQKYTAFLVAVYWKHEPSRGQMGRTCKLLFDFTHIWKNSDFPEDSRAMSYANYDDPDDYWDRANITSTEIKFTDQGKRNTDYKDVYIPINNQ